MGKIITITNQKGGVGKTTTSLNLAYGLCKLGKKVLVIDFDPQGNLTSCFTEKDKVKCSIADLVALEINDEDMPDKDEFIVSKNGVDLIPSNKKLSALGEQLQNSTIFAEKTLSGIVECVKNDYDYVIIDTNPSLGILTINALTAADETLITLMPEKFALDGFQELLSTIRKVKKRINSRLEINGLLLTMCRENTVLHKTIIEEVNGLKDINIYVYDAKIPTAVAVGEAILNNMAVIDYDPKGTAAEKYMEFAREFLHKECEV